MAVIDDVRALLGETLQLGARADALEPSTALFGGLPEFDSMAVVWVVTALEERFGLVVDDDEITAEVFETLASLAGFVEAKLAA